MSARIPLLVAGLAAVLALGLLGTLAPAASAAPTGPATTTACTVHVALVTPSHVPVRAAFPVFTVVTTSGSAASCTASGYQFAYVGFQLPTPNAPGFTTLMLQPGTYHVAVIVHGSFGAVLAWSTFVAA